MRRRGWLPWLALAAMVVVAGVLPFWPVLDVFPHGVDATKWVQQAHPENPGWAEWVFASRHFVGWRPIAALTFTLDALVGGYEPRVYHLTDFALHGAVAVLLFATYRALTGDRSAWGLLAPTVFLLHPASEDVVPHLARRSYSLSSALALLGVIAFARAARERHRSGAYAALAAVLLALGLMTNEVTAVVVALLPVLAAHLTPIGERTWRRFGALLGPMVLAGVAVVAARWAVLGGLVGGYGKRYVAYSDDGIAALAEAGEAPYADILRAAWSFALFPTSAYGRPSLLLGSTAGWVAAGLVLAFYAWVALLRPLRRADEAEARLPLVLVAWTLGYAALYALTRNWFWRQGYPMTLPVGLLVATSARVAWALPSPTRWLALAPQALLLVSIGWHAPAIRGIETSRFAGTVRLGDTVRAVLAATQDLDDGDVVWLVLPTREGNAHQVRQWAHRMADADLVFRVLAVSEPTADVPTDTALLRIVGDDLVLPKRTTWSGSAETDLRRDLSGDGRSVPLAALARGDRRTWVLGRTAEGWELRPVGE